MTVILFSYSKEDVERCKQKDLLAEILAEMTGDFPEIYEIIVKERDAYLARSLRLAAIPREVTEPDGGMTIKCPRSLFKPGFHLVVTVVNIMKVTGVIEHVQRSTPNFADLNSVHKRKDRSRPISHRQR